MAFPKLSEKLARKFKTALLSDYFRTQQIKPFINTFVTPINLINIIDSACSGGRHGCNQQGNSRPDVG